jgi:hypothetical protein
MSATQNLVPWNLQLDRGDAGRIRRGIQGLEHPDSFVRVDGKTGRNAPSRISALLIEPQLSGTISVSSPVPPHLSSYSYTSMLIYVQSLSATSFEPLGGAG